VKRGQSYPVKKAQNKAVFAKGQAGQQKGGARRRYNFKKGSSFKGGPVHQARYKKTYHQDRRSVRGGEKSAAAVHFMKFAALALTAVWLGLIVINASSYRAFIPLAAAFIAVNGFSFYKYAQDKLFAIKHEFRTSERMLVVLAALGPFGAAAAMELCRHKTNRAKFLFWVPLFCVLHLALLATLALARRAM